MLAARISPDYAVPPSFDADDWFRGFQAFNMTIDPVEMPGGILRMPSQFARQKFSRNGGE